MRRILHNMNCVYDDKCNAKELHNLYYYVELRRGAYVQICTALRVRQNVAAGLREKEGAFCPLLSRVLARHPFTKKLRL